MQNFINELAIVQDPRTGNAKKHKLSDILFIAIAAGVADCNTWNEIEDYAIAHEAFFRKYLELPAGIPSHNTFNRVFAIRIIRNGLEIVEIKKESVISIDGKCIRGAGNKDKHGAGYAHMLSACLSE